MRTIILFYWAIFSSQSWGAPQQLQVLEQTTEFYATGKPSMLKIHGSTQAHQQSLSVEREQISGKMEIDLKTFESGMSLRDEHMRNKVFQIEKYPTVWIVLDRQPIQSNKFVGTMHFRDQEKKIEGVQSFKKLDQGYSYEITFKVLLTDFGVTPPAYFGMKIENEVEVNVKGKAK